MVEVAWPGWVRGKGAPAASRGRHFSRPLGSFFWRLQDPGWGVGSVRGPAAAPARLSPLGSQRSLGVAWVTYPELGTRQSRSPQVRLGCLRTPAPSAPTPRLPPHSPRGPGRARAAAAAALLGAPSPAQPRPRPRPTCCLSGSPTPSPWAPGSVSPHLADGKTESQQQRIPRAL